MADPRIVKVETSAVFLPPDCGLWRLPRAPRRKRPMSFWNAFEGHALFYDCFWSHDEDRVLLIGPPPYNLLPLFERASFVAQPSGADVNAHLYPSRSTMVTALSDVPAGTTAIEMRLADMPFTIPVRPLGWNLFADRCLAFTMSKDNDLDWIAAWADWHVRLHGADAVLFFDNGSTRYDVETLERTLAEVPGLATVCVISWPYRYGPVDPAVFTHRYWANFLQVASLSLVLRRFAGQSAGLLNCDVDELVGRMDGQSVFDVVRDSPDGYVRLRGTWVESAVGAAEAGQPAHLAYRYRHRLPLLAVCADKWVLDPARDWTRRPIYTPMMHRIYGVPPEWRRRAPVAPFWHFKAINTNWKALRRREAEVSASTHLRLADLDGEISAYERASASDAEPNAASPAPRNANNTLGAS